MPLRERRKYHELDKRHKQGYCLYRRKHKKDLCIDDIAGQVHLSPFYFQKGFSIHGKSNR